MGKACSAPLQPDHSNLLLADDAAAFGEGFARFLMFRYASRPLSFSIEAKGSRNDDASC
jgi:hypothetical protein